MENWNFECGDTGGLDQTKFLYSITQVVGCVCKSGEICYTVKSLRVIRCADEHYAVYQVRFRIVWECGVCKGNIVKLY